MGSEKSLYEYILQGMQDGKLREGFSLPSLTEENGVSFADGAMDGIALYHMGRGQMDSDAMKLMIRAVRAAGSGNEREADQLFSQLGKSHRAVCIIDDVQKYIYDHRNGISVKDLYASAVYLLVRSSDRESVKFGLSITELITLDERDKEVIRRLGLSDEFTVFAVWNMLKWDNANEEIFDLVQKVHGWGRIHALEKLEPETPEIRDWILFQGLKNDVMPAYSALAVWEKADVIHRLNSPMTAEEFSAVGDVFNALLDEGPCAGISAIEDSEQYILKYLSLFDVRIVSFYDYENVFGIYNWAEETNGSVEKRCLDILTSDHCREEVIWAVKQGKGIAMAELLNIPYADDLYRCMKDDFDQYGHQCGSLLYLDDWRQPVIDLFRERLPLTEMRKGPSDEQGLGAEYKKDYQLGFIVQALQGYPGSGEDLVITALYSPVIRNRYTAVRTLNSWCGILQKPLTEVSQQIHQELHDLVSLETEEELISMEQKLLDGEIPQENGEDA